MENVILYVSSNLGPWKQLFFCYLYVIHGLSDKNIFCTVVKMVGGFHIFICEMILKGRLGLAPCVSFRCGFHHGVGT